MADISKPKMRPLSIEAATSDRLPRCAYIEALTEEAEAWVKEHAPEFGDLYHEFGKKWCLMVYKGYSREEVIAYLLNKWDSERWPENLEVEEEQSQEGPVDSLLRPTHIRRREDGTWEEFKE